MRMCVLARVHVRYSSSLRGVFVLLHHPVLLCCSFRVFPSGVGVVGLCSPRTKGSVCNVADGESFQELSTYLLLGARVLGSDGDEPSGIGNRPSEPSTRAPRRKYLCVADPPAVPYAARPTNRALAGRV